MRCFLALGLLVVAGLSIVNAADKEWWQDMLLYQIYPRSFQDSDGDGIGDLPGIESRLEHLVDAGIDAFWISPFFNSPMVDFGYDISNFVDVDPTFGTMEDFESLTAKAKSLGLKVILDFVPNHSSDQHDWFNKSLQSIDPYTDYYVWHSGKVLENGTVTYPNNWVSVFSGPAWTWREERQAYYLHQFTAEQPDLNFTNPYLIQEMKDVLVFWLDKGADGFRVDAIPHLFEIEDFRDEPLTGYTDDTGDYGYVDHIYTKDLQGTYDMVRQWRDVLDDYSSNSDNIPRIMMTEAYTNYSMTMKYYEYGAHFTFNFNLISYVSSTSSASDFKAVVDEWMTEMPTGETANWVIGNHDKNRVASRFGSERSESIVMMAVLLPGVGVTYNGEEIGMEDRWISWEDTQDPQACNTDSSRYESYSRDPERTPFQWDNTTSAGFSTNATTWLPVNDNYLTLNLATQKEADVSHYKVYKALVALRDLEVIKDGDLQTQLLNDNVFAFARVLDGYNPVIVVINCVNNTETVSLDVFSSAPETMQIHTASAASLLVTGTTVSRSSLVVPAYAGIVLTASETSSASLLTPTAIALLAMTTLANLHH